ncbi:hypothetical protein H2200_005094 [Cladophialophora chaetospira]|uniref:UBC core domain-containing protein n=1 Tax=Cladophialophora chaetospira TaxID=386627 RepID=A0AA38XBG5_9EURO|nr:hypothetical protein H2200_005094 [Cladophialophora chaetospira]
MSLPLLSSFRRQQLVLDFDVFHPLVVPLTTYTFSTNVADDATTVSASSKERLPPGAFTLRYAFPHWFSFLRRLNENSETAGAAAPIADRPSTPSGAIAETRNDSELSQAGPGSTDRRSLILDVLRHVKEAFESEDLLDRIPLDEVGDPSAWHAWRAYRGLPHRQNDAKSGETNISQAAPPSPKNPGEWKWDGVLESRVRNSVEASISEAALFGNTSGHSRAGRIPMDSESLDTRQRSLAAADRQLRFSKLSEERFEELKVQCLNVDTAQPAS